MADTVHAKVTTGTAIPEGHGQGKMFPPLDPTGVVPQLFWLALTFGLLYLLLKRFALPRVGEVIEERRERIERDLAKAEALKVETAEALASYEQALGEARARASTLAKDVHAALTAEVDAERSKLDAELAAQVAAAEARIAQERARAMAGVGEIAGQTAGAIVAKLIGGEVSHDEVKRALMQRAAE
ncbi:MAG TPA: F0F1 ATP synthase subunit B' [Hyphomicrobiaceae bacterium]|nr:F0F1 ATP synthase subunit B' [Hyphomicrobiaceae bacterium]